MACIALPGSLGTDYTKVTCIELTNCLVHQTQRTSSNIVASKVKRSITPNSIMHRHRRIRPLSNFLTVLPALRRCTRVPLSTRLSFRELDVLGQESATYR
jgi:hypothetical protein